MRSYGARGLLDESADDAALESARCLHACGVCATPELLSEILEHFGYDLTDPTVRDAIIAHSEVIPEAAP